MLELIILISLTSLGLFITGQDGFILFKVRMWFGEALGGAYKFDDGWYFDFNGWTEHLFKPIWGCPTCMSSFWGVIMYLLFADVSIKTFYELPILILSAACINFIVFNNLIKKWL